MTLAHSPLFDFLGTADPRCEHDVEQVLVDHIQSFLLELGTGFAFVGHQVPLEVGDRDVVLDLLFYHLRLPCYVVVEYALRDMKGPIGVAGWKTKLVEKLPKALASSLQTVAEIEEELSGKPRGGAKE